jgi:hypothetical protein
MNDMGSPKQTINMLQSIKLCIKLKGRGGMLVNGTTIIFMITHINIP